jgi:hypothetical protein
LEQPSGDLTLIDIRNYYYKILSWNVRGLKSVVRQENVRHVINTYKPELIYLQETKMALISPGVVRNTLGTDFENNFLFLPAVGTSHATSKPDHHQPHNLSLNKRS